MKIFISYRRQDTSGYALAIRREIMDKVSNVDVILDSHFLRPGARWREELAAQASACDVALVLIGNDWLVSRQGQRRIEQQDDPVRAELERLLDRPKVEIIPVLVDGAKMPSAGDLPEHVRTLCGSESHEIHHKTHGRDLDDLLEQLAVMAEQRGVASATGPGPPAPPAGSGRTFAARITERFLEQEVYAMGRDHLLALVAELRRRGWTDEEIDRRVLARSPLRPSAQLPTRITVAWLAASVPFLSPTGIRRLTAELVRRGWSGDQIRAHVFGQLQVDLAHEIPARIQLGWLERNAPLMTAEEQDRLAEVMLERRWALEDVRDYLPYARASQM